MQTTGKTEILQNIYNNVSPPKLKDMRSEIEKVYEIRNTLRLITEALQMAGGKEITFSQVSRRWREKSQTKDQESEGH